MALGTAGHRYSATAEVAQRTRERYAPGSRGKREAQASRDVKAGEVGLQTSLCLAELPSARGRECATTNHRSAWCRLSPRSWSRRGRVGRRCPRSVRRTFRGWHGKPAARSVRPRLGRWHERPSSNAESTEPQRTNPLETVD